MSEQFIWETKQRFKRHTLPRILRQCMFTDGSLMRCLHRHCQHKLTLQPLTEGWQQIAPTEAKLLALRMGEQAWVRDISLSCADKQWLYARSIIPRATVADVGPELIRLGTRPLGKVLFAEPTTTRRQVNYLYLPSANAMTRQYFGSQIMLPVYARRSLFEVRGQSLLVMEFFLPDVGQCQHL